VTCPIAKNPAREGSSAESRVTALNTLPDIIDIDLKGLANAEE
jgi:hypothetical protein